jgi:hypothetical protein
MPMPARRAQRNHVLRQAEVHDLDVSVRRQHDVGRFEIAMDNAGPVRELNGFG